MMNVTKTAQFFGVDPLLTAQDLESLAADLRMLAAGIMPDRQIIMEAPLIHEWRFTTRPNFALSGSVYNHPRVADGKNALTSEVFAISSDRRWARTMSRFYDLGPASLEGLQ